MDKILIEKMKLETRSIKDVEIIRTGKYKGKDYTENELDQFVENFTAGIAEPVLNLDHDPELTGDVKKELKVASLGYVESLKRVGDKLYADFKQVPKLVADLIEAGTLKQRSIEFYKAFKTSAGKMVNNVLIGVSFFGTGLPAVAGMSDLMNFFKSENMDNVQSDEKIKSESIIVSEIKLKEAVMADITIPREEYDSLLKIKAEFDSVSVKLKDTENQTEAFKTEISDFKSKLETAEKIVSEYETFKTEQLKKDADALKIEAETYIGEQITKLKLLPKFKDFKIAEYIRIKADKEAFEMFKSEIENRPDMIPGSYKEETPESKKDEFKNIEDVESGYEKLIAQGKTHAEALQILGVQ